MVAVSTLPNPKYSMASIVKGKVKAPVKTVVYGIEGVGKTTFAMGAPKPIFLPVEEGTNALDLERLPRPETLNDIHDAVTFLETGEHDFRSLVVDTMDAVEQLVWKYICANAKPTPKEHIEDFGYGKGPSYAVAELNKLLARFDHLRESRRMNVILIAHAAIRKFQNPEGDDFDRWELKLAGKGAPAALKEWADDLLFAQYETIPTTDEKTKRVRGVSTDTRQARTVHAGAYDAKNRFSLPDPMPLKWEAYRTAILKHYDEEDKKAAANTNNEQSKEVK